MEFWEIIKSVIFGIVQGITEWLPISSTGHLLLLDQFMDLTTSSDIVRNKDFFDTFKVVIQLGSILAVLVLYFHKLNPFSSKKTIKQRKDTYSLWWKVLIATIPAGVIGVLFDDMIDGVLSTPFVIATTLIIYGFLFLWLENGKHKPRIESLSQLDYKTAIFIGVFQILALIPGTSRSGATILGAVFLGASRYVAAEFSFFLAIPVMVEASGIKLLGFMKDYNFSLSGLEWGVMAVAFITAFAVSLVVIRFLINYIKKHDFKVFGYYRIALGALILIYFGFIAR